MATVREGDLHESGTAGDVRKKFMAISEFPSRHTAQWVSLFMDPAKEGKTNGALLFLSEILFAVVRRICQNRKML